MALPAVSVPYDSLAPIYDRWTADNDFGRWADFIVDRVPVVSSAPSRLLDLCCGTGTMLALLGARGSRVTGVDQSRAMLARARQRLGHDAVLLEADVRDMELPGRYDVAISTFDSLNYLVGDGDLERALSSAARALVPGGWMIFDLNTRHKLEVVFGDSHYGDDLDDFAYVWRNSCDAASSRTRFQITLFRRRGDGLFVRSQEQHVQRWFSNAEVRAAAVSSGLEVVGLFDDYRPSPTTATTLRETWVLRRL